MRQELEALRNENLQKSYESEEMVKMRQELEALRNEKLQMKNNTQHFTQIKSDPVITLPETQQRTTYYDNTTLPDTQQRSTHTYMDTTFSKTQQQPSYAYANTTIPEIQHRPNYTCIVPLRLKSSNVRLPAVSKQFLSTKLIYLGNSMADHSNRTKIIENSKIANERRNKVPFWQRSLKCLFYAIQAFAERSTDGILILKPLN
ncbi:unnamed protein product [Mytilus edulis]|uniref:Uncharacterized protein n=1 Tax=Mytilus edulis TaxID=6550 RepID=A0A8S3SU45_MYTED|nr:unnamed protein product [Mytilus edulis]